MKLKNLLARISGNTFVVIGIKYIPLICTVLMTLHVGLLLAGIYEPITVALSAILILTLFILLSLRFNFCLLHKMMIMFLILSAACICLQKYDVFGGILGFVRVLLFGFGCAILGLAFIKWKDDECDKQ